MKPRAELIKTAPIPKAQATIIGVIHFHEHITRIRSRNPNSFKQLTNIGRLSRRDKSTSSIKGIGAAPAPSTVNYLGDLELHPIEPLNISVPPKLLRKSS